MGNYFTNVQGRPDDMGKRVLRRRIAYNQAGFAAAAGIPVGAIEKGGVVTGVLVNKNVPFSAGATVSLGNAANAAAGQAAVVDSFATSASIAPASAGPATGVSSNNTIGAEMPADTIVYAYLGGTAATAGDVTVVIEYCPAFNWSDNVGGQAT